jgi:hypothetical protein
MVEVCNLVLELADNGHGKFSIIEIFLLIFGNLGHLHMPISFEEKIKDMYSMNSFKAIFHYSNTWLNLKERRLQTSTSRELEN